jgi:coenzyme PQQ precursor peptide PqqA
LADRTIRGKVRTAPPTLAWVGVLQRSQTMRWSKPKIIELAVGLEINSYACAEIA